MINVGQKIESEQTPVSPMRIAQSFSIPRGSAAHATVISVSSLMVCMTLASRSRCGDREPLMFRKQDAGLRRIDWAWNRLYHRKNDQKIPWRNRNKLRAIPLGSHFP